MASGTFLIAICYISYLPKTTFCSLDNKEIVDTYIHFFSQYGLLKKIGIVQVVLYHEDEEWEIQHYPDPSSLEIVQRAYINRHFVDVYQPNGVIVTIHGLLSKGEWNSEIVPSASSQGWIVAPYIYDSNTPDLLTRPNKRTEFIDNFRDWIYDLSEYRFPGYPISVIAHSFGTYIIAAYLDRFEEFSPVHFNCIILTGSIINSDFNWEKHRGSKVAVYGRIKVQRIAAENCRVPPQF
ncbi:hypothetical protein [Brevibacillus sp. FSL K6-2834]|uniref:hypothetical protein n=1 Tax=Brevibacillus sp. FSL K6-2834 TaxID=2954680 RepID=UPI003157F980